MTIIRDGKSIVLTDLEVLQAYNEIKNKNDREDVETVIDAKGIEVTDDEFEIILDTYKSLRRHDESWWEDAEWAIDEEMGR